MWGIIFSAFWYINNNAPTGVLNYIKKAKITPTKDHKEIENMVNNQCSVEEI